MDDFANHPVSITEARSRMNDDAAVWTPRDVLIHVLRLIDGGEWDPQMLVVISSRVEGSTADTRYSVSSPNPLVTLGAIERARALLTKSV